MPYVGQKPADIISTAVDTVTGKFSGEIDAASLDISGNIDVDGTSNLDIVDIDGAVNIATTALITGVLTTTAVPLFNGGIDIPTVNTFIKGGGHNVIQVDANTTYFYGGTSGVQFRTADNAAENITFSNTGAAVFNEASNDADFRVESNGNASAFFVNGADGVVHFARGSSSFTNEGATIHQGGGATSFITGGGTCMTIGRTSNDGTIVSLRQDGDEEGTISVSGGTVSFNAFSGSHWSRLTDNSKPTILRGTIIETIDEMCDWYQVNFTIPATDDQKEYKEVKSITLPSGKSVGDTISYVHDGVTYDAIIVKEDDNKHTKCKISDTADSKRVYGVHAAWDNDDDTVNDMYVTAVGTHVVRINKDITVSAGDLLVSNGDGTAKVQDDDIIRSKTIGKVLTNIKQETYDDDSYIVPCALYCG